MVRFQGEACMSTGHTKVLLLLHIPHVVSTIGAAVVGSACLVEQVGKHDRCVGCTVLPVEDEDGNIAIGKPARPLLPAAGLVVNPKRWHTPRVLCNMQPTTAGIVRGPADLVISEQ